MNLFIRSARIYDPTSKYHNQVKDILIQRGIISRIGTRLKNEQRYKELAGDNLSVSPGWLDMFAFLGDPGYEYKEDINSGALSAAAGGFTMVCCMPNTHPALDSKSEIEYVINKSRGNIVDIKPIGAISVDCEGNDLTEIYDMREAGAIAFSDGINSCLSAGLMLRSLLYVKPFEGLIVSHPDEKSIRNGGVVNEGVMSTMLGLGGIPAISEELVIMRDIYLAEYTGSRVHFAYVSSAGSVDLIRKAKAKGLKVTCSVSPYSLMLDDSSLSDYDTNYKVLPPLKARSDIHALIDGLADDTIDNFVSMHIPQDIESKQVEFDFAEFGMLGLETAYSVINSALNGKLKEEKIIEKLAISPRQILGMEIPAIKKDEKANLTIFDCKKERVYTQSGKRSRSANSPFFGIPLQGSVIGIVNNNQLFLN